MTTAEQGCGEKRSSALLDHFFSVFSTPVFRLFRSFQHFPQRIPLPTLSFFARGNASMMKNLSCCLISPSYHLGRHLPCALRDCFSTALCPWRSDEAFPPLASWNRCAVFPPRCTLVLCGRWQATCFRRWAFVIWSSCAHVAIYR